MLSYEPELARLRDSGAIGAAAADALVAIDRRERFSIYWELRVASYIAVLLITTGVGIFVKNHYDEIGPIAIIAAIALAAAGCYAFSYVRLRRGAGESAAADYVLLLGALLLSADVGFAESQFHLLGASWPRHFLLLAVIHAATAYYFRSRIILSVAITSLAAWFGVEQNVETLFDSTTETGTRALGCAAAITAWRCVHARASTLAGFLAVFDHSIANLAMWGAIVWCFDDDMRWLGLALLGVFAFLAFRRAFAAHEEIFALYGGIYFYIGASAVVVNLVAKALPGDDGAMLIFFYFIVSIPVMVATLFVLHQRFRRSR